MHSLKIMLSIHLRSGANSDERIDTSYWPSSDTPGYYNDLTSPDRNGAKTPSRAKKYTRQARTRWPMTTAEKTNGAEPPFQLKAVHQHQPTTRTRRQVWYIQLDWDVIRGTYRRKHTPTSSTLTSRGIKESVKGVRDGLFVFFEFVPCLIC